MPFTAHANSLLRAVFAVVPFALPVLGDSMERWDFASGMLHPHWQLESRGLYSARAFGRVQAPTLEVVDLLCLNGTCADGATLQEPGHSGSTCDCLAMSVEERKTCKSQNPSWADPGDFWDCRSHTWPMSQHFLSSAVPWHARDREHPALLVRSFPFILGQGNLTFWMFGGCLSDCTAPRSYYLRKGKGPIGAVTGVALRTTEDDVRVAVATADNEHEWQQETWTSQELADFVGKEVTLDIHDTRHGAWGWLSVDDFVVPVRRYETADKLLSMVTSQEAALLDTEGRLQACQNAAASQATASLQKSSLDATTAYVDKSVPPSNRNSSSKNKANLATIAAVLGWSLVAVGAFGAAAVVINSKYMGRVGLRSDIEIALLSDVGRDAAGNTTSSDHDGDQRAGSQTNPASNVVL